MLRPRPIPGHDQKSLDYQYEYQESWWTPSSARPPLMFETKTKTCLDFNILLWPRTIPGLDHPSLESRDQYQEYCWTLLC